MKKIFLVAVSLIMYAGIHAQGAFTAQMQPAVTKLNSAVTVRDYQQLSNTFLQIASIQKTQWLPYYYAAFCNAKIGWLKQQDDPDNIEPFARKALEEITTAESLLDTSTQKKELSEVYCVLSMANRAMVFINSMSYGSEYGPEAAKYIVLAERADSDNPRALYLDGWQKYYTPKLWGGNKKKAKELLEQSLQQLAAEHPQPLYPHWGKKVCEEILSQYRK